MRIILVVGSLPPDRCGVGDYTRSLALALDARGDMNVAVLAASGDAPSNRVPIIIPPHGWRLRSLLPILREIRRWHPDIVHIQFPSRGYDPWLLPVLLPLFCALIGVRFVHTWHEYRRWVGLSELPGVLLPGGLVVVRPEFKERTPKLLRRMIAHKKFRFIPNASTIPVLTLGEEERQRIRERVGAGGKRLVVYFGFAFEHKGIDRLFEICDPDRDMLVIATELKESDAYHRRVLELASQAPWRDRCHVTGYLPADDVAELLAAADAVVLPFRTGGGHWNTSLQAALSQGTFVVTTATDASGYDANANVFFAKPDDVAAMRTALDAHAGMRVSPRGGDPWETIATEHVDLYRTVARLA